MGLNLSNKKGLDQQSRPFFIIKNKNKSTFSTKIIFHKAGDSFKKVAVPQRAKKTEE